MTGFIGGGNMAEALIKGMTSQGMKDIFVAEPREERRRELEKGYAIRTTGLNEEVVSACDILFLAVKPQHMDTVLDGVAEFITEDKTVVSIAAGVTLAYLEAKLGTKKLIRVMPNTPALVQEGMSVMSLCGCFYGKEAERVRGILMSIGKVLTLPESMMNAVTALSGSGPAFIARFVEALIASGERMGISGPDATLLAVQTVLGTAKLLDTGMSAENLRKMVTSPGGTTEAGLKVFGEKDLEGLVAAALEAARKRAEELGRRD
jgi:pyrroline-5-carboxylate reductase